MSEDQKLIKEILNGSDAAMEVLTRKYYKLIFAYIYRKVYDKELTSDLTQEVFIKMMKRLPTYSQTGEFKNWLITIAVNHCRDYWKSSYYKHSITQTEVDERITSEKTNVSYIFEKKQDRELVRSLLQELPELQKEVILLRYYHDMKLKDIATVTDSKESTVKSRLKQGIGKLSELMKGRERDESKTSKSKS